MSEEIAAFKRRLADAMPERLAAALASYDDFAAAPAPAEAKGFATHHSACKAALAHVELLLKLVRWADRGGNAEEDENDMSRLIAEARGLLGEDDEEDNQEDFS